MAARTAQQAEKSASLLDAPIPHLNQIVTGDARELAKAIPDNSIDLIFTDPDYTKPEDYAWLSDLAMRVLKPDSACLAFYGIGYLPETHAALLSGGLTYRWRFVIRSLFGAGSGQWLGRLQAGTKECAWYEKGKSKLYRSIFDLLTISHNEQAGLRVKGSVWGKTMGEITPFIAAFTKPGAVVLDTFTGEGTIPTVCKKLGRSYIGFEIDPERAATAHARVANTQAMAPIFLEEQLELV